MSIVINPGVEADPRLLNTGPSPFGWHRYEKAMICMAAYGYGLEARQLGHRFDRPALALGTLAHLGLAHYYSHLQARQQGGACALYSPLEAIERLTELEIQGGGPDKLWMHARDKAIPAVRAYLGHYATEGWTVVYVERAFELVIGDAVLTQRLDLVIDDRAGVRWVVDHKTTGRITAAHQRFYSQSGQFIGMTYIGKALWPERFGGAVLNLLEIPEPGGKPAFKRPPLLLGEGPVSSFGATIGYTRARMRSVEHLPFDAWPRSPSEHTCQTRYGPCDHVERCRAGRTPYPIGASGAKILDG